MRKLFLALVIVFGTSFVSLSQKYGYIDSDYILNNMDEYTAAKDQLNKLVDRWTEDLESKKDLIQDKKDNFAREEVLLPKEEKEKRQEEISKMEEELMGMQKVRFGVDGDYFQKRQELIKPIQDRVYEAMQKVASRKNYSFIFDKANQSNLIYADSKFDISEDILKELSKSK